MRPKKSEASYFGTKTIDVPVSKMTGMYSSNVYDSILPSTLESPYWMAVDLPNQKRISV